VARSLSLMTTCYVIEVGSDSTIMSSSAYKVKCKSTILHLTGEIERRYILIVVNIIT